MESTFLSLDIIQKYYKHHRSKLLDLIATHRHLKSVYLLRAGRVNISLKGPNMQRIHNPRRHWRQKPVWKKNRLECHLGHINVSAPVGVGLGWLSRPEVWTGVSHWLIVVQIGWLAWEGQWSNGAFVVKRKIQRQKGHGPLFAEHPPLIKLPLLMNKKHLKITALPKAKRTPFKAILCFIPFDFHEHISLATIYPQITSYILTKVTHFIHQKT